MSKSLIDVKSTGKRCCKSQQKKRNLIAKPGCTGDDEAVAALPDKWIPRHAGPILAQYLKDKENNHRTVIADTESEAVAINNTIDLKIRKLAEYLLSHTKQNEQNMNCVVENLDLNNKPLSLDDRSIAFRSISRLYSQRVEDLADFKREALALERQRADDIRKLLQAQFQRLINVGHRPPRDLLHEFDQQIYEINQQLLSNCRAYAELEAQLHAQADDCVVLVKSNVNQISLGVNIEGHRHSAFPWNREEKVSHHKAHSASIDKRRGISLPSIDNIISEAQQFDECVSLIVQAYRTAVMKVFSGFSGKLTDLHSHLGFYSSIEIEPQVDEIIDLQSMVERVLRRLSISVKHSQANVEALDFTRFGIFKMQKSLWSLGERLRDTYTILHDASHLWDAHMIRSALAQKLTMACVEDLLTSNDTVELANEVNFNIALEQLRSASDTEKLQQQYEIVLNMLERTSDMYEQHSKTESNKLEEFMNFPEKMANTLMSELHCFLEKFPRTSLQITGSALKSISQTSLKTPRLDANTLQMPLPRAIVQTELQELSLLNWRNGFLETFENNLSNMPQELQHHARTWVDEKARALHMRHSSKLVAHSIRTERVRAARDNRLAELNHHDTRLESHLDAVYDLVDGLPTEATKYLSLDSPELYPFCQWIDRIQANIDELLAQDPVEPETKMLKMCSYAPRLIKHRILFEKSLDAAVENGKIQLENRIQEARISNVRFMLQLKLFSEGGRYSAQEAARTCTSLVRGADAIESCLLRATDALNVHRSQILLLADQKLQPIQKIVEEFAKLGGKGAATGKVKPAGKKK